MYEKRRAVVKAINKFWPVALMNHSLVAMHAQHNSDQAALSYLEDVWIVRDSVESRCFTLEFVSIRPGWLCCGRICVPRGCEGFADAFWGICSTSRRTRTSRTRCSRRSISMFRHRWSPRTSRMPTGSRRQCWSSLGSGTSSPRYVD